MILTIWRFFKAKSNILWILNIIKIKISMIGVSKEYQIKTKKVQEQWLRLKVTFLFFYWVELTFGGEGIKIWWGGGGGGGKIKFLAGLGDSPHRPSRENHAVLKKCSFFSYSLLPKIIKFRRASLRLVFLIKIVCNQFLLLKKYRLWHWIRSFVWFIPTDLESVIFDYPTSYKIPIAVESVEILKSLKWKKECEKE